MKKYLNKMKIVEHCDSLISEVPVFKPGARLVFEIAFVCEVSVSVSVSVCLPLRL